MRDDGDRQRRASGDHATARVYYRGLVRKLVSPFRVWSLAQASGGEMGEEESGAESAHVRCFRRNVPRVFAHGRLPSWSGTEQPHG